MLTRTWPTGVAIGQAIPSTDLEHLDQELVKAIDATGRELPAHDCYRYITGTAIPDAPARWTFEVSGVGPWWKNTDVSGATKLWWQFALPVGSTLERLSLGLWAPAHSSLPEHMPHLRLWKWSDSYGWQDVAAATVDASADIAAYDQRHYITIPDLAEDGSLSYVYWLEFMSEYGANSVVDLLVSPSPLAKFEATRIEEGLL